MYRLSVIILCGGLGTRLRSQIGINVPKILAPIGKNYFFDYLIDWLDKRNHRSLKHFRKWWGRANMHLLIKN